MEAAYRDMVMTCYSCYTVLPTHPSSPSRPELRQLSQRRRFLHVHRDSEFSEFGFRHYTVRKKNFGPAKGGGIAQCPPPPLNTPLATNQPAGARPLSFMDQLATGRSLLRRLLRLRGVVSDGDRLSWRV